MGAKVKNLKGVHQSRNNTNKENNWGSLVYPRIKGYCKDKGGDPEGKCKDRKSLPRRARCPGHPYKLGMKCVYTPECPCLYTTERKRF